MIVLQVCGYLSGLYADFLPDTSTVGNLSCSAATKNQTINLGIPSIQYYNDMGGESWGGGSYGSSVDASEPLLNNGNSLFQTTSKSHIYIQSSIGAC